MNDERSNDRTNERSEFRQHNGRKKIIWTNERTNDQTIGRMDHERSDERTNKLRTGGRMIEERPNDPCASVCLCGRWSGRTTRRPCPSIDRHVGGIRGRDERISGRTRELVGD
jgi:hypothetical protein